MADGGGEAREYQALARKGRRDFAKDFSGGGGSFLQLVLKPEAATPVGDNYSRPPILCFSRGVGVLLYCVYRCCP